MVSFDLNTNIEFVYSQLVCSEMKDSKRVMSAILLLNNYLTKYEHSIGDLKLGKLLTTMQHAINYCREHAEGVTFNDMQNFIICVTMHDQRIEQLNERGKEKFIKKQQCIAQMQNCYIQKKASLSIPVNKKVGRNDIFPYCDSGKKIQKVLYAASEFVQQYYVSNIAQMQYFTFTTIVTL